MIKIHCAPRRTTANDLRRVIEPLASYICATDRPKAALQMAYTVLFNEVAQVNRAAQAQVARFARATSKKGDLNSSRQMER
jgi:hypothetical protein